MIVCSIAGVMSYLSLGREEDPAFTIKTMLIQAQWPGASVEDTINQVTERIEKKLEELEALDYTKSLTTPGQTTIFVNLRDTTKARDVQPTWNQVRNMVNDIRGQFPSGTVGPAFNDRFGDVFGNIYAFTSDGLSTRQLRDYVEDVRAQVLLVPNVGRVDLIGAQDEVIFLEISTRQIAALGIDRQTVLQTLRAQNAIAPSGVIQAGPERVSMRVGGQFTSEESLRTINLRINDRFFRLSDVATITRGYVDPPTSLFRFNGQPAIGLAIGMKPGANLLQFGEALKEEMRQIIGDLPIGVGVHLVSDQPVVVEHAVGGFTRALFEAVAIVLVVSFISLGVRAGLVVALAIPLVLAITFLAMAYLGISLQRISLGALIIALGLLVDDAMIAVEMMVARLEAGDTLQKAATYVYTSTAFPMLTGTLVTVAGFIPIGLNSSAAGEYTFTLFVVIAVSLVVSWIVAVVFTPLLGVTLLPATMKKHHDKPGRFTTMFSRALIAAMRWRWITIAVTVVLFLVSLAGMQFVQQQFFPSSDRPELIVDFTLPQNSSIAETKAQMDRFETTALRGDPDIGHWSSYVGQGAVRFLLSFDVQPANPFYGQIVVVTKSFAARERVKARLEKIAREQFVGTDVLIAPLALGPPSGRPVQYRVSGPEIQKVREVAQGLAAIVGENPRVGNPTYDWNEPARVVKVEVLQDKARQLGVTSEDIAATLNGLVGGSSVTQVRDDIYLVNVIGRAREAERGSIDTFQNLQLPGKSGQSVPLAAVATFRYELEQPVIWRRSRVPTITVKATSWTRPSPRPWSSSSSRSVREFTRALPHGYKVAVAGPVEDSAKAQGPIAAVVPLMLIVMATILMLQLQSFQRLFLVVAVAPLGADRRGGGAAAEPRAARLRRDPGRARADRHPDPQLRHPHRADRGAAREGRAAWDAVVEATEHRTRPILLTAGGREPGAHSDRARGVLGTDGLRHDGRHHRRDGAHASVPSRALRRLVPHQGARAQAGGTGAERNGPPRDPLTRSDRQPLRIGDRSVDAISMVASLKHSPLFGSSSG